VLPGGVAIMSAALDELGIESMKVSEGALRHGVLYDLLGRVEHRDMREATVAQFVRRYHVDSAQAQRIRDLSLTIYDALAPGGEREDDPTGLMLDWAARLAEIGLSIEHAQYHKHSAYVLSNADMPGFPAWNRRASPASCSRTAQALQGAGCRPGRQRLEAGVRASHGVPYPAQPQRPEAPVPAGRGRCSGFAIDLPQSWLDENPLSAAALESEADYWKASA